MRRFIAYAFVSEEEKKSIKEIISRLAKKTQHTDLSIKIGHLSDAVDALHKIIAPHIFARKSLLEADSLFIQKSLTDIIISLAEEIIRLDLDLDSDPKVCLSYLEKLNKIIKKQNKAYLFDKDQIEGTQQIIEAKIQSILIRGITEQKEINFDNTIQHEEKHRATKGTTKKEHKDGMSDYSEFEQEAIQRLNRHWEIVIKDINEKNEVRMHLTSIQSLAEETKEDTQNKLEKAEQLLKKIENDKNDLISKINDDKYQISKSRKKEIIKIVKDNFAKNEKEELSHIIAKQIIKKQINRIKETETLSDILMIEEEFFDTIEADIMLAIKEQWEIVSYKIKSNNKLDALPMLDHLTLEELSQHIEQIALKIETLKSELKKIGKPLLDQGKITWIQTTLGLNERSIIEPLEKRKEIIEKYKKEKEKKALIESFKNAMTFDDLVKLEKSLKEYGIHFLDYDRAGFLFQKDLAEAKLDIESLRDISSVTGIQDAIQKAQSSFDVRKKEYGGYDFFRQIESYYQKYTVEINRILKRNEKEEEFIKQFIFNPFDLASIADIKETKEEPKDSGENLKIIELDTIKNREKTKPFSEEEKDDFPKSLPYADKLQERKDKQSKQLLVQQAILRKKNASTAADTPFPSPGTITSHANHYKPHEETLDPLSTVPINKVPAMEDAIEKSLTDHNEKNKDLNAQHSIDLSDHYFISLLHKNKNKILLGFGIAVFIILSIFTAGVVPAAMAGATVSATLFAGLVKIGSVLSGLCFGLLTGSVALGVGGAGLGLVSTTSPWWAPSCFNKIKDWITSSEKHEIAKVSPDETACASEELLLRENSKNSLPGLPKSSTSYISQITPVTKRKITPHVVASTSQSQISRTPDQDVSSITSTPTPTPRRHPSV